MMNEEWIKRPMMFLVSRLSGLAVLGALELALRAPAISEDTRKEVREFGGMMAWQLLEGGLEVRQEVRRHWEEVFQIKLPESPSEGKPPFLA